MVTNPGLTACRYSGNVRSFVGGWRCPDVIMTLANRTRALAERLERAKSPQTAARARHAALMPATAPPASAPVTASNPSPSETVAAPEPVAANNRRAKRKPTSLPAMITFTNMRVTVPCTVADMSGTGAQLTFAASTIHQFGDLEHLPQKFTLVLKADRMQVASEVKWRREGKIGVRFLGPPKPIEPTRR